MFLDVEDDCVNIFDNSPKPDAFEFNAFCDDVSTLDAPSENIRQKLHIKPFVIMLFEINVENLRKHSKQFYFGSLNNEGILI